MYTIQASPIIQITEEDYGSVLDFRDMEVDIWDQGRKSATISETGYSDLAPKKELDIGGSEDFGYDLMRP